MSRSFDPEYDDIEGAGWVISEEYWADQKKEKEMRNEAEFERDLKILLNRCSIDSQLDMPDFIIAEMLTRQISAMVSAHRKTLEWGQIPNVEAKPVGE